MTLKETIKGLECCQTKYSKNCNKCPYEIFKVCGASLDSCDSRLLADVQKIIKEAYEIPEESKNKPVYVVNYLHECAIDALDTIEIYSTLEDAKNALWSLYTEFTSDNYLEMKETMEELEEDWCISEYGWIAEKSIM